MSKNYYKFYKEIRLATLAAGILLFVAGIAVNQEIISEILTTIGPVLAGLSIGGLIIMKLKPGHVKQEELESKDERNIQINEKAITFAWYVGLLSCLASLLYFQAIEEYTAFWLVSAVVFAQFVSFIAARLYFNRKM